MNTGGIRQQHLEYDHFFFYQNIFKKKSCPFTNIYQYKKTAFLEYRFFMQHIYIYIYINKLVYMMHKSENYSVF